MVVLIGVKLRFIESEGGAVAAGRLEAPSISAGPVQIAIVAAILVAGFTALTLSLRRVESTRPAARSASPQGSDRAQG